MSFDDSSKAEIASSDDMSWKIASTFLASSFVDGTDVVTVDVLGMENCDIGYESMKTSLCPCVPTTAETFGTEHSVISDA